jgi:glycosyltransferase involved in cell wall biosynthesis
MTDEAAANLERLARRRIVVLLHGLDMGGAERQALHLVRELRRWRGRVELWSLQSGSWGARRAQELDVPVRVLGFGTPTTAAGVLHMTAGLARRLIVAQPDYLIPFLDLPNLLANLAWRTTRARGCIWNQRSVVPFHFHPPLERLAFRMTNAVVANSQTVLQAMEARFGSIKRPSFVVHNGVELGKAGAPRSEWRARLGISDGQFVACMVANLTRYKDHETAIRAWRLVVDATSAASGADAPVLVLAGNHGDTAASIRTQARTSGIENALRFPGHVDDVSGLLEAADLGVLTSVSEGCPNAVLEYMAAGLPVAASDVPAIREILSADNLP